MLIAGFPDEMWMLQQSKEEIVAFFSKKQLSKSSDKTSSTTESSAAMFLVVPRPRPPRASENSDQMIRFNLFRFLSGKKCSSICPEKTTENSIKMVNALGISKCFSRSISLTVFCRKITRTIERIVGTLTSGEM